MILLHSRKKVLKARPIAPDLVTNGGFDTDSDWSKPTGWTISAGKASCVEAGSTFKNLTQNIPELIIGVKYRVTFTVLDYVTGEIKAVVGATSPGTGRTANGTYTEDIVCQHNSILYMQGVSFTGSIDDVEVFQLR